MGNRPTDSPQTRLYGNQNCSSTGRPERELGALSFQYHHRENLEGTQRRKLHQHRGTTPEEKYLHEEDKNVMEEAVANFAVRCTEKLRRQGSVCQGVTVFAWTSRFNNHVPEYTIHDSLVLPIATDAQDEIVGAALTILRARYPKSVSDRPYCPDLSLPSTPREQDLFDPINHERQKALMAAIDAINHKNGYGTIRQAIQGTDCRFDLKREYMSKRFTTNISDILEVKC